MMIPEILQNHGGGGYPPVTGTMGLSGLKPSRMVLLGTAEGVP